jgi:hypothetical protein
MKTSNNKGRTQSSGCLSKGAGCLVALLIFPFSITFAFWFAFALGPMSCALPNRCSKVAETAKGIVSIVILVGGGFVVPLTVGRLVDIIGNSKGCNRKRSSIPFCLSPLS